MASSGAQTDVNPFGDSSLFQQFDDERSHNQTIDRIAAKDSDKDKLLADLKKENEELKRRLRLLEPPSGGQFTAAEDSPVVQVIFMHHENINKKRQAVEDFVQQLVTDTAVEEKENSTYDHLLPQRSALRIRGANVTFLATGSVQYYTEFCLDILGRPLVEGEIALTEDWEVPLFERGFPDPLPFEEGAERKGKKGRPKPACFNCGDEGHALRDCTAVMDFARINAKKKEFQNSQTSSPGLNSRRYHKESDSDQRYAAFKPGVVSDELRKAMGLPEQALPDFIYTMRMLGYPPGYLKEAEITSSGLAVYDKLKDEEGEIKDIHDAKLKYNADRLIKYPGFNVPPPEGFIDNHQFRNMPPMQDYHQYEAFHAFMSSGHPDANDTDRKKRKGDFNESDDKPRHKKSRVQEVKDMDISFSPQSPGSSSDAESQGSPFRPPLPRTPANTELPPLPLSTPPATPGDTPRSSVECTPVPSPSVSSSDGIYPDRDSQDSLDDLVSQQRALLNELDDAANKVTSSESDAIGRMDQTPVTEEEGSAAAFVVLDETFENTESMDSVTKEVEITEDNVTSNEQDPMEGGDKRPSEGEEGTQNGTVEETSEEPMEEEEEPNKSGVPHRRNFAEGITPHVDENVSASKGVFKKILGLLKISKS